MEPNGGSSPLDLSLKGVACPRHLLSPSPLPHRRKAEGSCFLLPYPSTWMFCHSLKAMESVDHRLTPLKHDPRVILPLLSQFSWVFWHKDGNCLILCGTRQKKGQVRSLCQIPHSCYEAVWNSLTDLQSHANTALCSLREHTGSFGDFPQVT